MLFLFHWVNFLSMDAICVALLWQEVFAHTVAVQLSWQERLVLGLSVWIVYILDHLLDVTCCKNSNASRHHFVRKHSICLSIGISMAAIANITVAFTLPHSILIAGALLGISAIFYLGSNTFFMRKGHWLRGREAIIALIFAFGCGLIPLLKTDQLFLILASIFFFAFLSMINCLLIARMERNAPLSLLRLLPEPILIIGAISLFFLLSNTYWKVSSIEVAFCTSLFGLSLIPAIAKRYGYEVASLATDGALMIGALLSLLVLV